MTLPAARTLEYGHRRGGREGAAKDQLRIAEKDDLTFGKR